MPRTKPNAYGARLTSLTRLCHPVGLVWWELSWDTDTHQRYTARTYPGGDVNRVLEKLAHIDRRTLPDYGYPLHFSAADLPLVDVILNGRSQVVWVDHTARTTPAP